MGFAQVVDQIAKSPITSNQDCGLGLLRNKPLPRSGPCPLIVPWLLCINPDFPLLSRCEYRLPKQVEPASLGLLKTH